MQGLPDSFPWKGEHKRGSGLCMMLIALKAIKKYLEVASFELYFKGFVSLICSKTHSVGQL